MDDKTQTAFRARITARLTEIDEEDARGEAGQATVELDQQAVGRLSRQDALQSQAMARATHARRDIERRRLRAALTRLDEGEFGWCEDCGEEIATARLTLDPAITRCISCARG
ncbi:TraR/DksA family transcriptional regulator [Roseovarius autotrophicus]|uniref:TraR/DksA family transcriptional regulator n=1 Tax=Roseovarius autotrophicus TaxID=2824121 RepID=UPI0019F7ABF3|nr:TraR/DksA C4-type zinc finger protein [Roseovarius autotrophicus]MBE0453969.1 TraR/DksA C4-type zinc finger protein [Roseovarius sp.]